MNDTVLLFFDLLVVSKLQSNFRKSRGTKKNPEFLNVNRLAFITTLLGNPEIFSRLTKGT